MTSSNIALNWKYNGVELNESLGLDLYEMDMRQYDPAIARWNGLDVVTHFLVSPYSAMDNNPVFWADPSGADSWTYDWNSNDGTYVSNKGERSKDWQRAIFETEADLAGVVELPEVTINHIVGDDSYNQLQNKAAAFRIRVYIAKSKYYSFENQNVQYIGDTGYLIPGSKVKKSADGFLGRLFYSYEYEYNGTVYGVGADGRTTGYFPQGTSGGAISLIGGTAGAGNLWKVGRYKDLRKLKSEYDAHHVGQKALMNEFIPGYDKQIAPSILVPKEGHTIVGATGRVSTSMEGVANARQLLARDILELRRVYPTIPNTSLKQLIKMNKKMYPNAFKK